MQEDEPADERAQAKPPIPIRPVPERSRMLRTAVAEPVASEVKTVTRRSKVRPKQAATVAVPRELTGMEKRILSAAREPEDRIYVLANVGSQPGEIKAGSERFFGNDAVRAVARLIAAGLVVSCAAGDGLELTELGRAHLASS